MTPCGFVRDCRFPSSAAAIINWRAAQTFRATSKSRRAPALPACAGRNLVILNFVRTHLVFVGLPA